MTLALACRHSWSPERSLTPWPSCLRRSTGQLGTKVAPLLRYGRVHYFIRAKCRGRAPILLAWGTASEEMAALRPSSI